MRFGRQGEFYGFPEYESAVRQSRQECADSQRQEKQEPDAINPSFSALGAGQAARSSGGQAKGWRLPIIGKYSYTRQIKILSVSAAVIGTLFFSLFLMTFLSLGHDARMYATVTEMQMLSQHIVI